MGAGGAGVDQGWRTSDSTRTWTTWPAFKSRRGRHTWVEFAVCSLVGSKRIFPAGYFFSHRHDILRWCHVDKCRATRGNQIFGLKEEEEDLLTVIRRTNSLPRLQNTCRFAITFIFSQPATARKNNSFLTRSCDLDFFYKNTMTGASAVISNADFLHLKQATKFSTVNEALSLFFWQ